MCSVSTMAARAAAWRFECRPADKGDVVDYLRERELVTHVYKERIMPVLLSDGRRVPALAYVIDRAHVQYAGALTAEEAATTVAGARGKSGANIDYVMNTLAHLKEMGIRDHWLEEVAQTINGACRFRPERSAPPVSLAAVGGSGRCGLFRTVSISSASLALSVTSTRVFRNTSGSRPARDRRQDAHLEMAGKAQELAPRPEQARMHGDRHHRHRQVAVEPGDAVFVLRRRARRAAGAFGIDDQLPAGRHFLLGAVHHRRHDLAARAAIDGHHALLLHVPAEKRDPDEFAFQDEERIGQPGQERIDVPEGLMLRREDVSRPCGRFSRPSISKVVPTIVLNSQ